METAEPFDHRRITWCGAASRAVLRLRAGRVGDSGAHAPAKTRGAHDRAAMQRIHVHQGVVDVCD
ncbi:hypothetical protein [Burkholderia dolosa]|uniref:Uncharacterized protein n=1 Tax=Burkholderia dolosa TaxID=152500 RepID=A0A892I481_9BURK|nr:hypothetical protein [Burkholderia dolosa]MBY4789735.1 hypothetical protein [Burkholderia dolosa]MCC5026095.1 hypothetical protein [Burkholderia dolosa]QRO77582.1 hypothetical protein I6K02_01250 [Burkholderia dolosa]UAK62843.1 hypothetical protein K8O94_14035 [Burkholderia dolosa]